MEREEEERMRGRDEAEDEDDEASSAKEAKERLGRWIFLAFRTRTGVAWVPLWSWDSWTGGREQASKQAKASKLRSNLGISFAASAPFDLRKYSRTYSVRECFGAPGAPPTGSRLFSRLALILAMADWLSLGLSGLVGLAGLAGLAGIS
jgi:hypothetical protein